MKLKKVQTYQPVLFNKQNETHFDIGNPRFANIQLTYLKDMGAVQITMPGVDSVIVFSTNVAYVKPESDISEKVWKSAK
jgi:hypothetical protein